MFDQQLAARSVVVGDRIAIHNARRNVPSWKRVERAMRTRTPQTGERVKLFADGRWHDFAPEQRLGVQRGSR